MAVNPNGYVNLTDGGTPRIITGVAKQAVSGGWLLGASGAAGVVSSGADSFVTSDIQFFHTAGSSNFVGIALHNAASGAYVSVATRGSFILEVSGTPVLAGEKVVCNQDDEVCPATAWVSGLGWAIGRAWTTGSDGEYVIVDIHG